MTYCKVRQAEIYYEDLGEGKPIIMMHGYSPDHLLMSGCMELVNEWLDRIEESL
ncbi:hypothetical protein HMPREF1015_01412 [Bacillus smithii 7_3_47FAA]|uniref:Alpha/beta hydrolase n=1 Tax=Bacillus smithii 7_3_47FAA TaxID=665952 RepID=G9QI48_9BACI|nr:hypothetical protein HMPREF1015_01412 [Bacillus smithii 7_3_47FAA]